MRVGYSLSQPAIAEVLNRIRQPFNVNSLAQSGALAALEDVDYVARARETNDAGLRVLAEGLTSLGLKFLLFSLFCDAVTITEKS